MWTQDDFPGANSVPWRLLIRARYQYEFDAVIASSVVSAVARVASADVVAKVAEAGARAVAGAPDRGEGAVADPVQRGQFLDAVADWDGELCPRLRPWPWPWPPRRDDWLEQFGDPAVTLVLAQSLAFVEAAGSGQLQGTLGATLREVQG